ncbi:PREDICTED: mitogen-activated protein kinase kinase kinase 4 isoform X2 [Nicrophorus vespilloides]|uniref:Mitogen-activated protein kinase kinase kinase 4 isoform X2 n=1 Tax=Nicrophorus vespilloides TaxID=110193 RepID=A0ABM1N210_NICVS|nr:PREDICTED: mitogen-activated protein kinase kinase kinase 4 isoform X2 [Nicrophorus vespilloides]
MTESLRIHGKSGEFSDEELLVEDDYDCYGKTPPRTRLLRKSKEKKNRDKENWSSQKMAPTKKLVSRSATVTNMFEKLITNADNSTDSEQGKRSDKRSIKLLRGSERDLKLDISSAQMAANENSLCTEVPTTPQSRQIEGCNRFKCLRSKQVAAERRQPRRAISINAVLSGTGPITECPQSRIEFYETFSMLIKMGCIEKSAPDARNARRHVSREELWQNELKDLIWLELQAWHADRTVSEEDAFLCKSRESVGALLNNIMTYKFQRRKNLTAQSKDSGIVEDCLGCLSMYCQSCMEAQNEALKDIEDLMNCLETAESLFPSSSAFADWYPLYNSPEFVGRVKAMCLWYNMTKHQRLKLVILGRLLALLENKDYQWPMYDENTVNSVSPSDSNSSNSSSITYDLIDKSPIDMYNTNPIVTLVNKKSDNNASPYRKYIENILKTRGLSKSMSFLDRLHNHILRKAQITLQKPNDESIYTQTPGDNQDEELLRYGCCSPEAKSLNLPSYKASFLFLSGVPLEVVHEFLRMRLQQKPERPSPLSVRQLMRELKEGIKIATSQRESIQLYIETALDEDNDMRATCMKNIEMFDESLLKVFEDYLEYMGTWALLQHDSFQKNLLEEEWKFICTYLRNNQKAWEMAVQKLCSILASMLTSIAERLATTIENLAVVISDKENEQNRKQSLFAVCRELQSLFNDEREMSIKIILFAKMIIRSEIPLINVDEFRKSVVALKCTIPDAIERVQAICDIATLENLDEAEKVSLTSRCREILMQGYRFGFEFHKEMSEFVPAEKKLALSMVQFAQLWMKFTCERCERGRGKRPRWAYQGLDFLLTVCQPQYTAFLSENDFEELKKNMDKCISHVIGTTAPTTPDSGFSSVSPRPSSQFDGRFPRSRGSSPSPRPTYRSQRSASRKTSVEQNSPLSENLDHVNFIPPFVSKKEEILHETLTKIKHSPALRSERIKEAVDQLNAVTDKKLREQNLIGTVISKEPMLDLKHIRRKNVTFCWQRGIKIGQGRFGKVYTAVNNDTGEMMAVKEVSLQHNDAMSVRTVTEEIKVMEGISHMNLVKYYGLEVHKEEMLIFMEFCPEGTLESLVAGTEGGLPELLIRRYTFQLLSGLSVLHEHGIAHRDIKTANIFLSEEGNCLKIGDFGCAVKIKSHVTMPGELQGFVGTQAYMAPEMFMKTSIDGHGRVADVWSVGCVVVEMSSGERPWAEFDNNYQIMFKVGLGGKPEAADTLIDEGHDFLELCLRHDPLKRATVRELLSHNFVKVCDDL